MKTKWADMGGDMSEMSQGRIQVLAQRIRDINGEYGYRKLPKKKAEERRLMVEELRLLDPQNPWALSKEC
jgi:hypothetical protein